jgi:excisionase family DNA binding protein
MTRGELTPELRALRAVPRQVSTFDLLLDDLAERIAERVIERVDQHLADRAPAVQPDAYRVDEAAQAVGLSERETKRLIASGELGSVKVGRARLVPRTAISAFLNARGA